uniref:Uncharacterized protein n=1 Tax=Anguilla anguilla TaxID=7936 RepID=A0A0E9Q7X6_ANGAN
MHNDCMRRRFSWSCCFLSMNGRNASFLLSTRHRGPSLKTVGAEYRRWNFTQISKSILITRHAILLNLITSFSVHVPSPLGILKSE